MAQVDRHRQKGLGLLACFWQQGPQWVVDTRWCSSLLFPSPNWRGIWKRTRRRRPSIRGWDGCYRFLCSFPLFLSLSRCIYRCVDDLSDSPFSHPPLHKSPFCLLVDGQRDWRVAPTCVVVVVFELFFLSQRPWFSSRFLSYDMIDRFRSLMKLARVTTLTSSPSTLLSSSSSFPFPSSRTNNRTKRLPPSSSSSSS